MNRSQPRPRVKRILKTVFAGGLALVLIWIAAKPLREHRADQLAVAARDDKVRYINKAVLELLEARWLSPNRAYDDQLADLYLLGNRPDLAIGALKNSGQSERGRAVHLLLASGQIDEAMKTLQPLLKQPTAAALILKSQVLLEQGREDDAIAAAKAAVAADNSLSSQVQLALADAINGHSDDVRTLIAAQGSPQAAETLASLIGDKMSLAKALYVRGLLTSSQRVLTAIDSLNSEGYILKAEIQLARHNPDLSAAASALEAGVKNDPSNLPAHRLLLQIYQAQHNSNATHEQQLIDQLTSGKV